MIRFKELRWENALSYGKNNFLRLDSNQLTQITGKNGHGKSSIGNILEEVLYNQNSKKLSRSSIPNRYIKKAVYSIELDFNRDAKEYTIKVSRNGTTGTVKLYRDGEDISSHTATGTYENIKNIIGYDFKTFSQIIYQGSSTSMEFLTATDTARKKFLIELLNLTKYSKASEIFKSMATNTSKLVDSVQSKISTVNNWLSRIKDEDLVFKQVLEIPPAPTDEINDLAHLNIVLSGLESSNKKIVSNNTYIRLLSEISLDDVKEPVPYGEILDLSVKLKELQKELTHGRSAKGAASPTKTCTLCGSILDDSHNFRVREQFLAREPELVEEISNVTKKLAVLEKKNSEHKAYQAKVLDWEKYHGLINKDLPTELLDKDQIAIKIANLSSKIKKAQEALSTVETFNTKVAEHNSKAKVLTEQKTAMSKELEEYSKVLNVNIKELNKLQILVKAFSTTGLVAYKIECLVKDLEELTNEYLQALSAGRFQIAFKINSSDKLNVVITDNGTDVDMLALSNGEKARVNTATLLAIRKLMQSLSNSRTNLLILDETVENLDAEGKEKLIEVLLLEENLNTFLVSHGFTHPLLEKLHVIKENNISRIE